ncbi:hypothetical protein D3C73_1491260 [compost metagenome]
MALNLQAFRNDPYLGNTLPCAVMRNGAIGNAELRSELRKALNACCLPRFLEKLYPIHDRLHPLTTGEDYRC